MVTLTWKALLLGSLVSQSLGASTSTPQKSSTISKTSSVAVPKTSTTPKATVTSKPSPTTKTKGSSCAYAQTTLNPAPKKSVCNGRGSLSKAAEFDRICYDPYRYSFQGQPDCYHSCSRDAKCVSFGWDAYNQICHLYSKPVADMGFHTNETSLFIWDLGGCYVCDQPSQPVKSACPALPTDAPDSQKKNHTCGVTGSVAKDNPVAVFDSYFDSFIGCYQSCVDYERSGLCQSFSYGSPSFKELECRLYSQPLSQLGFKPGDGEDDANFHDLRGCYDCDLPPTSTREGCTPTDIPVHPNMANADFQSTQNDDYLNRTEPTDWSVSYAPGLYSAKQGTKGNLVGAMYNPGHFSQFLGAANDFDQNPYSPSQYYNVTFEWALPSYKVANETAHGNCTLFIGATSDKGIKLSPKLVGTTLRKRGPFLFGAAGQGTPAFIQLAVQCNDDQPSTDNITVWWDNVQYTQNGKIVAGVGAK